MSELDEIQKWMAELLRQPRALHKDASTVAAADGIVRGNARLDPVEQVEIYRQQFWLRHTASLVEDFPGLGGIVGQDSWEKLVEGYLAEHPPSSWTLRDLGRNLPDYVDESHWLPHHELCRDMARLEWSYVELFDAPEPPSLDMQALAELTEEDWQRAVVHLSPAIALWEFSYAVADLRDAFKHGETPDPAIAPERNWLVMYRSRDRRLYHRQVSRGAFSLLRALEQGLTLVDACERAASSVPEEADAMETSVSAWFSDWGRLGWVVDVKAGIGQKT